MSLRLSLSCLRPVDLVLVAGQGQKAGFVILFGFDEVVSTNLVGPFFVGVHVQYDLSAKAFESYAGVDIILSCEQGVSGGYRQGGVGLAPVLSRNRILVVDRLLCAGAERSGQQY